ncbi:heavy metal-associated domain-containing protein [Latilactobacillus sakei]
MTQIVKITGMKCDGCTQNVRERFSKIAGVQSVEVSLDQKQATLQTATEIDHATLAAALEGTHYTVD